MRRYTMAGCPVEETVRHGCAVSCPTVSTIWDGVHVVEDGEDVITVTRSVVIDAGRAGKTMVYVAAKEVEA